MPNRENVKTKKPVPTGSFRNLEIVRQTPHQKWHASKQRYGSLIPPLPPPQLRKIFRRQCSTCPNQHGVTEHEHVYTDMKNEAQANEKKNIREGLCTISLCSRCAVEAIAR